MQVSASAGAGLHVHGSQNLHQTAPERQSGEASPCWEAPTAHLLDTRVQTSWSNHGT